MPGPKLNVRVANHAMRNFIKHRVHDARNHLNVVIETVNEILMCIKINPHIKPPAAVFISGDGGVGILPEKDVEAYIDGAAFVSSAVFP